MHDLKASFGDALLKNGLNCFAVSTLHSDNTVRVAFRPKRTRQLWVSPISRIVVCLHGNSCGLALDLTGDGLSRNDPDEGLRGRVVGVGDLVDAPN